MPDEMIEEWRNLIIKNSIIVEPSIKIDVVKEDPGDNKFIEVAIAGKSDFIIKTENYKL